MPDVLLLRHAPTVWNEAGRIQGRMDPPLSAAGKAAAARWRLPGFAIAWPCLSSPLRRALETGEAMGRSPLPDPAFIEMDWGACEGRTLAELRAAGGAVFAANEALGLDFRPAGGETPREVGARVLRRLRRLDADTIVWTHKGVLRALLALASGWDMRVKPPVRFLAASAHRFRIDRNGVPALLQSNIPLDHRGGFNP